MATIGSIVLDRLEFGDMPPEKAPALRKEDRELMTAWIAQGHRQAELAEIPGPDLPPA